MRIGASDVVVGDASNPPRGAPARQTDRIHAPSGTRRSRQGACTSRAAKLAPADRAHSASQGGRARWAGHVKAAPKDMFSISLPSTLRDVIERVRRANGFRSASETIRELVAAADPATIGAGISPTREPPETRSLCVSRSPPTAKPLASVHFGPAQEIRGSRLKQGGKGK